MKKIIKILFINSIVLFSLLGFLVVTPILAYQVYSFLFHKNINDSFNISGAFLKEFHQVTSEYKDFIGYKYLPFNGSLINIQEDGTRYTQQGSKESNKDVEFLFFGPSTIWGYGVNDQNTIPSLFAQQNNVFTINYGTHNFQVRQSYEKLIDVYLQNNISSKRVIIFNDGIIDFLTVCQAKKKEYRTFYFEKIQKALTYENTSFLEVTYLIKPLQEMKELLNKKQDRGHNVVKNCSDELLDFAANTVSKMWSFAHQLAKQNQDVFIAVLPPHPAIGTADLSSLSSIDYQASRSLQKAYTKGYALIREKMRMFPEVNFIDLSMILNNEKNVYSDRDHYTQKGNLLYVKALSKELDDFLAVSNVKEGK